MIFKRINGVLGEVVIPTIGLSVGTMVNWQLTRREEIPPGFGEWDFRAVFSFLNKAAWDSEQWEKEIHLTLGNWKKGTQYRLERTIGRTVLEGSGLLIEGVKVHVLEGPH